MRDEHEAAALRLGLRTVLWHGISGDTVRGRLNDATFLQRNVRFHSQRGGVLLFHDRMRRDAMKHALHQLATDPGLRVVSLGSAVDAKYACQPSTVASR